VSPPRAPFAVRVLAACTLGLLVCPFVFLAIGALSHFPAMFSIVMLPTFLVGCGFLLFRYLAKPREAPARRPALVVLESLSWMSVGVFLFFVSGINLPTTFERVGAACTAFLVGSAICFPVVVLRRTALERRLGYLRPAAALAILLLILGGSVVIAVAYLRTPAAFI
jgi:hypothetical protein